MEENKSLLLKCSMTYGFILGIFWVVKYLFIIFSLSVPALSIVYVGATLAVPFIAYILTKRYRNDIGGSISFFHAWRFGTMMYFFAALLTAVEHYMYFQFVSPNFLADSMSQLSSYLKDSQVSTDVLEAIGQIDLSPIHMAIQGVFNNVFYGIVLSIPVAALLCKKNNTGTIGQLDNEENKNK